MAIKGVKFIKKKKINKVLEKKKKKTYGQQKQLQQIHDTECVIHVKTVYQIVKLSNKTKLF